MAQERTKFYNMVVHLVKNNRLYEENAAIKNVWQKDDNIFFDIYFYRNRKAYVFDGAFIHDLLDLTNEKYYATPAEFLKDFTDDTANQPLPSSRPEAALVDRKIFEKLDADLILLTFLADCCHNFTPIKTKIIYDYILATEPASASLAPQYVSTYLSNLRPTEGEFYQALSILNPPSMEIGTSFLRECVKICLSDGQLHYQEKLYLSEIVQTMRLGGVDAKIGL